MFSYLFQSFQLRSCFSSNEDSFQEILESYPVQKSMGKLLFVYFGPLITQWLPILDLLLATIDCKDFLFTSLQLLLYCHEEVVAIRPMVVDFMKSLFEWVIFSMMSDIGRTSRRLSSSPPTVPPKTFHPQSFCGLICVAWRSWHGVIQSLFFLCIFFWWMVYWAYCNGSKKSSSSLTLHQSYDGCGLIKKRPGTTTRNKWFTMVYPNRSLCRDSSLP